MDLMSTIQALSQPARQSVGHATESKDSDANKRVHNSSVLCVVHNATDLT